MAFETFDAGRAVTHGNATGVVEQMRGREFADASQNPVHVSYLIRFDGEDEPRWVDSPGVEAVDPFEGTDGPEVNELPAGTDGPETNELPPRNDDPFGDFDPGTPDFGKHDPGTPDFGAPDPRTPDFDLEN